MLRPELKSNSPKVLKHEFDLLVGMYEAGNDNLIPQIKYVTQRLYQLKFFTKAQHDGILAKLLT